MYPGCKSFFRYLYSKYFLPMCGSLHFPFCLILLVLISLTFADVRFRPWHQVHRVPFYCKHVSCKNHRFHNATNRRGALFVPSYGGSCCYSYRACPLIDLHRPRFKSGTLAPVLHTARNISHPSLTLSPSLFTWVPQVGFSSVMLLKVPLLPTILHRRASC